MKRLSLFLMSSLVAIISFAQETMMSTEASNLIEDASLIRLKGNDVDFIKIKKEALWTAFNWRQKLIEQFELNEKFSFEEKSRFEDQLGFVHIRHQILYQGIPIEFEQCIVHLKDNKVESINGRIFKDLKLSNTQKIEKTIALSTALNYVNAEHYKWEIHSEELHLQAEQNNPSATYFPEGKQVIIRVDDQFRLAYSFDIYAHEPLSRQIVFVDSETNEVIDTEEKIHTGNIPGVAHTGYSGVQNIITDSLNGLYRLRDTTRGGGVLTFDLNNSQQHSNAIDFTDLDNIWDNVNAQKDEFAGDAHWGAELMYDYLSNVHNRNSIDNQGFPLLSYVHYGSNYNNAFWDGQRMTYGDGSQGTRPLTTVDISGHEIAHGLTNFTSALRYRSESGALNESFSDIFGVALEFYARPNQANWLMGEDIGGAFRSISNPNNFGDPDTYDGSFWIDQNCIPTSSNDWCGVHTNSGVQNFWFYLLANGGNGINDKGQSYNVLPLGLDTAAKIAFRNLTIYLSQNSNHEDARFYSIQSAIDLYGACSPQVESVTNAWHAVGVGRSYTPGVDANFYAILDTVYCSLPARVEFDNNPNNVQSFTWNFGDGSFSNQPSPTHFYTSPGDFTVKLFVDGGVCGVDSLERTSYIKIDTNQTCPFISLADSLFTINECTGTLFDNGGLNGDYVLNSYDTVIIKSNQGDYLRISIDSLQVEQGYLGFCNHDYIELFDGPSTEYPSLGRYCRSSGSVSINSTSNSVTVLFYSDNKVSEAGFKLSWSCFTSLTSPNAIIDTDVDTTCNGQVNFYDKTSGPVLNRLWNFGDGNTSTEKNPKHEYTRNGTYTTTLSASNLSGMSSNSATKTIVVNRPAAPIVNNDSSCLNGGYKLSVNGSGRLEWYDSLKSGMLMYLGDTLRISNVTSDTNFYVQSYFQNSRIIGTPIFINGNTFYSDTTAELYFTVNDRILLESTILNSNRQGERRVDIKDSNGGLVFSELIYVPASPAQITLGVELSPGTYSISIGSREPGLLVNSTGANYPYNFGNFMTVTGSSMGSNAYPFFYYMIARPVACISERMQVKGVIDTNCIITSIPNRTISNQVSVYPNPLNEKLFIEIENPKGFESISVFNINGQMIKSHKVNTALNTIHLSNQPQGVYLIEIRSKWGINHYKVVKQ